MSIPLPATQVMHADAEQMDSSAMPIQRPAPWVMHADAEQTVSNVMPIRHPSLQRAKAKTAGDVSFRAWLG